MLKNTEKENHKVRHKIGTWRSLEAHLNGVQGVASSNLAVPTSNFNNLADTCFRHIEGCDSFVTGIVPGGGQSI